MIKFELLLKKLIVSGVLACGFTAVSFAADKVAIFDFDDRSNEINTNAQFIEKKINGIDKSIIVDQYNSKSNETTAIKMLKEIDDKNYKLIIVITTDAMRIASFFLKETPYLFTNVNNPAFIGIENLKKPGNHRSGVSYYVPIEEHIKLIKKIKPTIKKIGFIFNDKNLSRKLEFREAKDYCYKNKIEFAVSLIETDKELVTATKNLVSEKVDMIVMTSSGKLYDNTEKIVAIAYANKIPVYSYNKKAVAKGAIASLSVDYEDLIGNLLMPMVKKVLKENVDPGNIPVGFAKDFNIFLNLTKAKEIDLPISDEIIKKAAEKY
jgi:putative ABC transport system substrate-binding protein